ncbi:MAG: type I methionyl aminopeptidase [Verrucomicrobia bacterium RIFCSPHIGHO2_12_FULL_41_10]|nr:MAG: type I methionyl aminopeptidase [Verrucomicrobia bacterium RIFCSPHIGHO2_12_FULL_41_10]HLB34606.1 type I methionyl aminopeptidase [Chthoniobacterales bacterium]
MIPIKTAPEIEKMRLAGQAAATVLDHLASLVEPGRTTGEIDRAAGALIEKLKCKSAFFGYRRFPGQICISINEEVVHGIGGLRRLAYGDIVKIDVGVVRAGWIGDTARTVSCGVVAPATERLCTVTRDILLSALPFATAGRRLGDLSSHIEEQAVQQGFSVVKEFVGHGVGRKLHEDPQIPNFGRRGSGPKLKQGMTLAIEPMINLGVSEIKILEDGWTAVTLDKKPSAHFEHTILVTEGEPEILTRLP